VIQGDQASSYYIVKKGELIVLVDDKEVNVMESGQTFGE